MNAADSAVPLILEVDGMVAHFIESGPPTMEELEVARSRVGRIPACVLLADLHAEGLLTPDAAAATVGSVWSMSEYPDHHLDHDVWRALFDLAGYTIDGVATTRPLKPVRLYRGSIAERRSHWSWTDSREVAERYASGEWYHRPQGQVWTSLVEARRLLARNTGRDESEYVVDTDGLPIEAVS